MVDDGRGGVLISALFAPANTASFADSHTQGRASQCNCKPWGFLCVPSCPLWLKIKGLNDEGHEGSRKKEKARTHPGLPSNYLITD